MTALSPSRAGGIFRPRGWPRAGAGDMLRSWEERGTVCTPEEHTTTGRHDLWTPRLLRHVDCLFQPIGEQRRVKSSGSSIIIFQKKKFFFQADGGGGEGEHSFLLLSREDSTMVNFLTKKIVCSFSPSSFPPPSLSLSLSPSLSLPLSRFCRQVRRSLSWTALDLLPSVPHYTLPTWEEEGLWYK